MAALLLLLLSLLAAWIIEQRNGLALCMGGPIQIYGRAVFPLILSKLTEAEAQIFMANSIVDSKNCFLLSDRAVTQ